MRPFASLFVLLSFLPALAGAQGSVGGMGQGRVGGPEPERVRKPEDEDPQLWNERTAIVTPGDRVEYKFVLRAGETVFAAATSDAFDPALAFADEKGKVLAKNDDRAEGDQSPFLTFRAPAAGTYLLQVLSYRSAAGGRFTVKSRTFLPLDAGRGPASLARTRTPDDSGRVLVRIAAKKGEIVDFEAVAMDAQRRASGIGFVRVVGPTGVDRNDLFHLATPDGSPVFRAELDGDYYLEYSVGNAESLKTDFRVVPVLTMKTADAATFDLPPGEIKIVEFPVEPNLLVRSTVDAPDAHFRFDAPAPERYFDRRDDDPLRGETPGWTYFRTQRDSDDDVIRVFHGKGTARLAVRSTSSKPQRVTLRNSEALPDWTPDTSLKGDLPIGEARFFRLRTMPSELMKIMAKGERFEVVLDMFRSDGVAIESMIDRRRHMVTRDLYYGTPESFIVRLTCDGYGGAGTYTLRRDVAKATPVVIGRVETFTPKGATFGLFSVVLEGGKAYELVAEGGSQIDLLAPDGSFVPTQTLSFGGAVSRFFAPAKTGPVRIWLRGGTDAIRFSVRPFVPRGVAG